MNIFILLYSIVMSRLMNRDDINWQIYANQVNSANNNNLQFIAKDGSGVMTLVDSALQIPFGISDERPITSAIGMIRYSTDEEIIEYYSGLTNKWLPVSPLPPSITTVTPNYISQNADNTFTLSGTGFSTDGVTVTFNGLNGSGSTYIPTSEVVNSSTSISVTYDASSLLVDASNELPMSVSVTNDDTGFSSTKSNAISAFNTGPVFIAPPNPAPALIDTFPVQDPCASFVFQGVDLSTPLHYPLTFSITSGSAGGVTDISSIGDLSAVVSVPAGSRTLASAATYNFFAKIVDASGAETPPVNYRLALADPLVSSIDPSYIMDTSTSDIAVTGNYFVIDSDISFVSDISSDILVKSGVLYNSITSLTVQNVSGGNVSLGPYNLNVQNGSVIVAVPSLTLSVLTAEPSILNAYGSDASFNLLYARYAVDASDLDITQLNSYQLTFDAEANAYYKVEVLEVGAGLSDWRDATVNTNIDYSTPTAGASFTTNIVNTTIAGNTKVNLVGNPTSLADKQIIVRVTQVSSDGTITTAFVLSRSAYTDMFASFTSVGSHTFYVPSTTDVYFMAIAGGGGGGGSGGTGGRGAGGGAGELYFDDNLNLSSSSYSISVGDGGAGGAGGGNDGVSGSNTSAFGITAAGGGGGGFGTAGGAVGNGGAGGSGGGGGSGSVGGTGGTASGTTWTSAGGTLQDSPANGWGSNGATAVGGSNQGGGGGGGAAGVGVGPTGSGSAGGDGGDGALYSITGTSVYYAGGGGGGSRQSTGGIGGLGGGGKGTGDPDVGGTLCTDGLDNTGGGGGGAMNEGTGSDVGCNGGSGIILVRAVLNLPPSV